MKRSRRVWLKLMGSVAIGTASMGLAPGHARSHHRHPEHTKRKPEQVSPSGGFGGAPRSIAHYDNGPSHGGG
ncbi:hypothetical protein ACVWY2_004030 [Bradyrhizobium sp. JR6.1]